MEKPVVWEPGLTAYHDFSAIMAAQRKAEAHSVSWRECGSDSSLQLDSASTEEAPRQIVTMCSHRKSLSQGIRDVFAGLE